MIQTAHSKICFKCRLEKDISEFYKHPKMLDGTVNKCKECNKKDVRLNRKDNIQHYQEYDKIRAKNLNRKIYHKKRQDKYIEEYPERIQANLKLNRAVRDKKIYKSPYCEYCFKTCKTDGHHSSYSKDMWLIVTWLCKSCHIQLHTNFKYKINEWKEV